MRRIAALTVVGLAGVVGVPRLADGGPDPTQPAPPSSTTTHETSAGGSFPAFVSTTASRETDDDASAALARRWVVAMWSRQPGDGPFDWLDRVADVTAPDLLAELRSARPWLTGEAVVSASVEIAGVYPHPRDPATLTVTCVVHRMSHGGRDDVACVATVTVTTAPGGRLVVAAVR